MPSGKETSSPITKICEFLKLPVRKKMKLKTAPEELNSLSEETELEAEMTRSFLAGDYHLVMELSSWFTSSRNNYGRS